MPKAGKPSNREKESITANTNGCQRRQKPMSAALKLCNTGRRIRRSGRAARTASPRMTGAAPMRARILIVDDDQVYLAGMKELLEDAGYEVFLAGNFEDG